MQKSDMSATDRFEPREESVVTMPDASPKTQPTKERLVCIRLIRAKRPVVNYRAINLYIDCLGLCEIIEFLLKWMGGVWW